MRTNLGTSRRADGIFGLLDIGTSKTVCVIVAVPQSRAAANLKQVEVRVLGTGVCPSRGVKSGTVFELHEVEQVVREAVAQAERAAGTARRGRVAGGGVRAAEVDARFTAETSIAARVVERGRPRSADGGGDASTSSATGARCCT